MAKKKPAAVAATADKPKISALIREALEVGMSSASDALEYAKRKFPKYEFNEQSFASRFSNLSGGGSKRKKKSANGGNVDTFRAATKFVHKAGGVEKARKLLQAVAENPAADFATQFGGVDKATAVIDKWETELAD